MTNIIADYITRRPAWNYCLLLFNYETMYQQAHPKQVINLSAQDPLYFPVQISPYVPPQVPPQVLQYVLPYVPPQMPPQVLPYVPSQVPQQVPPQVPPQVPQQEPPRVLPQVPPYIPSQVFTQMPQQEPSQVPPQLPRQVPPQVIPYMPPQVPPQVLPYVQPQVPPQVSTHVLPQVPPEEPEKTTEGPPIKVQKVAITYKMELRSQTQNIIFAPQSVLESDFRRKDGNLEFKFNDPILGNLNLSLNWNRSGWKHFRHKIPTAWTNFDKLYLQKKLLVIKNRGVISHKCIRYGSTIDPELEGDYVPVSLSDGAKRSSTNWHQLQLYVNGGNISGHQNGEYFIVSHLCHHRNCVGDANDPKKVHLSFEPQKVNLSRQACVKKHKKDPNYCCPGHDYDENLYPKCIF